MDMFTSFVSNLFSSVMEGSDGSPPLSMWIVRAAETFPKPIIEKEDKKLMVPFAELTGEYVKYLGSTDDGVLALSNYRLFLLKNSTNSETSVPLGLIESAQSRDLFHLIISCKDASTVKCSFSTSEQCSEWQRRITLYVGVPDKLESLFAFPFYAWTSESPSIETEWSGRLQKAAFSNNDIEREVERLKFNLKDAWRISKANIDFKLCPSYPRLLLVPSCITDDVLQNIASFRSSRRIPVVVWRHKPSGAVIARCSQPEVGWLGWRNKNDEELLKALVDACSFDKPSQRIRHNSNASDNSSASSPDGLSHEEVNPIESKKILVVDARSYTSAVTNRARGGGCECPEYYPCAEIQFMNLGNIHAIRKSFHSLRQLCASSADIPNWLGILERTMWLQHMSGLLTASMVVCHAIERQERPVLVHCSDGWDRTPQIVATSTLCLDPYYRTVEGFRVLVDREWLNFGHKFADRCGHGPGSDELNERCPVFLQWLDCVHQIHRQFPCSFEFSMGYLIKLAQHSHSCLFGTFMCNTVRERTENTVFDRTFSVWPFLSGPMYKNPLYVPNREKVLWPAHNVRDLALWSEVYLGSLGNQNSSDYPPSTADGNQESMSHMIKTRSYGDLITAGGIHGGLTRRSSDPNMTVDSHLLTPLTISSDNSIDSSSDRGLSPELDIMDENRLAFIQDTTQKLQNLTQELNRASENASWCDEEIDQLNKNFTNLVDTKQTTDAILLNTTKNHQNSEELNSSPFYNQNQEININIQRENLLINNINIKTNNKENIEENEEKFCEKNQFKPISYADTVKFENGCDDVKIVNQIDDIQFKNVDEIDGRIDNLFNTNNMLESVDLNETSSLNNSPAASSSQNLWHGSVETSTDTLVPIEQHNSSNLMTDSIVDQTADADDKINKSMIICNGVNNTNCDIISKDVGSGGVDIICNNYNQYSNGGGNISNGSGIGCNGRVRTLSSSLMDESIIMQPLHAKLEINGKTETNYQRKHRRSYSNSKNELSPKRYVNGSISPSVTNSRFSTPGGRSLPLTPPGVIDKPSVTISCPDGLAHALSEQNLRLQQIVYEHKLREEALQRELYATRLALLKKTCQNCNNHQSGTEETDDMIVNDDFNVALSETSCISLGRCSESPFNREYSSSVDLNIENLSVCSWEAVEDRSGPSSGANSATNDLWVPDHAVSSCTGCHTEFWLGRRKHHCRSCGQIFCADCSEYWAPLPDKRLYTSVRLCAPCFNQVNPVKIQDRNQNQHSTYNNHTTNTLEPCKHAAANCPGNDRGQFKATTAN